MVKNILCLNRNLYNIFKQTNIKSKIKLYSSDNNLYGSFITKKYLKHLSFFNKEKNYNINYINSYIYIFSILCTSIFLTKKIHYDKNIVKCSNLQKVFLINKDEIKNGEMKEIKINDRKDTVLLINIDNEYYCVGSQCPHYSAPLQNGFLTKKYVTCPWHDAKFDIKTGECINGPSFNDIPKYEIVIEDNKIYAFLPEQINIGQEKKVCVCKNECERKTILIIGGGAAAIGAIETFLKNGYNGRLIVCSKDFYKPYDKTLLSKNVGNYNDTDDLYESIKLKSDSYYNENNVEFHNNVYVTKVDSDKKEVYLDNGNVIKYDKVLITSGLSPRKSPVKSDKNITNLININELVDNVKIAKYAKENSKCVIVGSSFIACEIASALKKKNINITIVTKDIVPFVNTFGEKIGKLILNSFKEKDIQFYAGLYPTEYIFDTSYFTSKNENNIHGVKLNNGEVLPCDYVIEAMGCLPNSDFIDNKHKDENNFIVTDNFFQVKNSDNMYAAGDVCIFPYFFTGEMLNICHWNVAIQQGRIAAHNMLNQNKQEFIFLPFFNTNILGNNFRVCGFAKKFDKIIYEGDLNKKNFVSFFVKDDKVISILTLGNNKMAALNECLTLNKVPKPYELEAGLKNSDNMIESIKI